MKYNFVSVRIPSLFVWIVTADICGLWGWEKRCDIFATETCEVDKKKHLKRGKKDHNQAQKIEWDDGPNTCDNMIGKKAPHKQKIPC